MQIAIDGPAGAGKSSVAKEIARKLGFVYIDTGAMYRTLTFKALKNNIDFEMEEKLEKMAKDTVITFSKGQKEQLIYCDGEEVTELIRTPVVSRNVSKIAQIKGVREQLVFLQRDLAKEFDVVMDGRDIGTVVLPEADLKVYLTASLEVRTQRRMKELEEKGFKIDFDTLFNELKERDYLDINREFAPLKPADDAIHIDTTNMNFDQVVYGVIGLIER